MPSLLPCRMPAWLAGVVEGSSASQWPSLCVPDRIQRRHLRHAPRPDGMAHDVVGEPIDLDDDEAGLVGLGDARLAAGHGPHERPVVRVVLAEAEERRHGGLQEAVDERDDQQADEARAHGHVRDERVEQPEDEGLEQQREEDEGDHRPAGDETDEDRPDQQVQGSDEDHSRQAASKALDLQEAGEQPGGDVEGDEGGEQRDQSTLEERDPAWTPAPQQLELRAVEIDGPLEGVHLVPLATAARSERADRRRSPMGSCRRCMVVPPSHGGCRRRQGGREEPATTATRRCAGTSRPRSPRGRHRPGRPRLGAHLRADSQPARPCARRPRSRP